MTLAEMRTKARVRLHGVRLGAPDLSYESRSLALSASNLSGSVHMYFALNAWWEPLEFELMPPPLLTSPWRRVVDTQLPPPDEIQPFESAPVVQAERYRVGPRSVLALMADGQGGHPQSS